MVRDLTARLQPHFHVLGGREVWFVAPKPRATSHSSTLHSSSLWQTAESDQARAPKVLAEAFGRMLDGTRAAEPTFPNTNAFRR